VDAKTDTGAVRPHNEDSFMVDPDRGLFVVCDGIGGHARGEVASSTACATIRDRVAAQPPSRHLGVARDLLVEAIQEANRRVYSLGTGTRRPGTTVAALLRAGGQFVVAHVGDSRVYRLHRGVLVQLTRDHSLANQLVDQHRLQPEQAADYPLRHVITRALGTRCDVEIDVQASGVRPGDVFLLASDGLEVLEPEEIRACLALEPAAATRELIARSLREGAPDNVTVIVVRAGGAG
jgi:serine/threonine protein phosphatase PrpC